MREARALIRNPSQMSEAVEFAVVCVVALIVACTFEIISDVTGFATLPDFLDF